MNKKTVFIGLAAAGALGLGSAQAGTVSSTLFSGFQQLSDNSAEYLINQAGAAPGDTILDQGDILRGIFDIETAEKAPDTRYLGGASGNNELTGVFEIMVTGKTSLGAAGYAFTFGPSASFQSTYGAGAMVAFYEDNANNYSRVDVGPCNTTACLEGLATDGSLYWVSGFGSGNDFWASTAVTDDISVVGSIPAPGNGGGYNVALSILTNNSGKKINQVNCFNPGLGIVLVDMCGSGSLLGTAGVSTPFDSFDDVNFTVNIPEPTSVMLMGLGLVGLGATALRRRRKA